MQSGSTVGVGTVGVGQSAIAATVTGLPPCEYLFVGAGASEGNDNAKTPDADYTERFDLRTGSGTAATEICTHVVTRIAIDDDDTCTSTAWTNTNPIFLLVPYYEIADTLHSTVTDNFDDNSIDGTKWDAYPDGAGSTVAESGEKAILTPGSSVAASYATFDGVRTHDLQADAVFVQVPQVTSGASETLLVLWHDGPNQLRLQIDGANLSCTKIVMSIETELANTPYDPATHMWWRIRESGGNILFDTSPNGNTWTNFATVATPLRVRAIKSRLTVYADNIATPGAAWFENYNLTRTTSIKKVSSVAYASIKKISGVAIASVKKVAGLA